MNKFAIVTGGYISAPMFRRQLVATYGYKESIVYLGRGFGVYHRQWNAILVSWLET